MKFYQFQKLISLDKLTNIKIIRAVARIIFFVFILNIHLNILSQNLVPNPSFEIFSDCPNLSGKIELASYWFQYNNFTSDYFNFCNNYYNIINLFNFTFEIQKPRTGKGMAGLVIGFENTGSYNEYFEVKLKETLKNKSYCLSFFISLKGSSKYSNDAQCACISKDSLLVFSNPFFLKCLMIPICNKKNELIIDTVNWVKISLQYEALGEEKFLILGNFKDLSDINFIYLNNILGHDPYYFIDDVSVYECDAPVYVADAGEDKEVCLGEQVTLTCGGAYTSAYKDEYLYQWFNSKGELISNKPQVTIIAMEHAPPPPLNYYVLKQKDFKFDETIDTVYVYVNPNHDCMFIPTAFTPNQDGINDYFVISAPSSTQVMLSVFNRWGELIYNNNNYQNNWQADNVPQGVYTYSIKLITNTGQTITKQGRIAVIK